MIAGVRWIGVPERVFLKNIDVAGDLTRYLFPSVHIF
jgi:hypothetical protein